MTGEGRLVGGRYRLDRRIGSGAMGVVWQAYDERLRRTVAIKQLRLEPGLDPAEANEATERAMREGRIAARLQHPNAVSVFDVVDEDGAPWLVMEYVPSRSLADEMTERGTLPPLEVARIGTQVAHALAAAHAAGIVHRDIKPANILIADNGMVKITDFGISRAVGDVAVTKTGLIAGTPAYLAPEVAYGRNPGAPADVFSLGSTLYAATEGQPPFGMSENTLSLLHLVAAGQIVPPRQSGPLTDVLISLLDPEPERRPDAATAGRWLDSVARGSRPNIMPVGMGTTAVVNPQTGRYDPNARTVAMGPQAARTRLAADPYGSTTRSGYAAGAGTRAGTGTALRPAAEEENVGSRKALIAGIVIIVILLLLAIMWFLGVFNGDKGSNTPTTGGTTTTQNAPTTTPFSQVPIPTYSYTTPDYTTQQQTTTTTTAPTTTTTTTTQPTTTTTTTTTSTDTTTTEAGGATNTKNPGGPNQ